MLLIHFGLNRWSTEKWTSGACDGGASAPVAPPTPYRPDLSFDDLGGPVK